MFLKIKDLEFEAVATVIITIFQLPTTEIIESIYWNLSTKLIRQKKRDGVNGPLLKDNLVIYVLSILVGQKMIELGQFIHIGKMHFKLNFIVDNLICH